MPKRDAVYFIDGRRIRSLEDFLPVVGEAVSGPGGYFGRGSLGGTGHFLRESAAVCKLTLPERHRWDTQWLSPWPPRIRTTAPEAPTDIPCGLPLTSSDVSPGRPADKFVRPLSIGQSEGGPGRIAPRETGHSFDLGRTHRDRAESVSETSRNLFEHGRHTGDVASLHDGCGFDGNL